MAQESVQTSKPGRSSHNFVLVLLLIPMFCGIIAGNLWMNSDKAGCPMVQSFGAQIGGNPSQRSDTADNCRAAIDAKQGWYTIFGIGAVYILGGGFLATIIAFLTVSARRPKPVVAVVQVSAAPSQAVDDRLRSMVSGTVIAGDPSAAPDVPSDEASNL